MKISLWWCPTAHVLVIMERIKILTDQGPIWPVRNKSENNTETRISLLTLQSCWAAKTQLCKLRIDAECLFSWLTQNIALRKTEDSRIHRNHLDLTCCYLWKNMLIAWSRNCLFSHGNRGSTQTKAVSSAIGWASLSLRL